jgi:hypothetical protein
MLVREMKADDVNLPNFKYCKKEEMEIKEGWL